MAFAQSSRPNVHLRGEVYVLSSAGFGHTVDLASFALYSFQYRYQISKWIKLRLESSLPVGAVEEVVFEARSGRMPAEETFCPCRL